MSLSLLTEANQIKGKFLTALFITVLKRQHYAF
jgi:hypothetical protein